MESEEIELQKKFIDALTIQLRKTSEKTIGISDLKSNGIKPVMLKQVHLIQDDDIRKVEEEEKKKTLSEWGIDIHGKIEIPSSKTLQDILALKVRPKGWEDRKCKLAIWQQTDLQNSVGPVCSRLTPIDYDLASAAHTNLQDILPPRLLDLLWHISVDEEWLSWPKESQVCRILDLIVSDDALFSIPARKSSANITCKVDIEGTSRHFSPFPDMQVCIRPGNRQLLVTWVEVDSAAKGADRCKMLLFLNAFAKCFSLAPNRTETILLIGVYVNYDVSIPKSTEITIFQIPPSHDNSPVQTFRYETVKEPDGAADFLNVMFRLLCRIGSCSSKQPGPFITVHNYITAVKALINAAGEALTRTSKRSNGGGSNGAGGAGGNGSSGAGGSGGNGSSGAGGTGRHPPGDGGGPPGHGGQTDSDASPVSKCRRLGEPDVDGCNMAAQLPVWVPLSPSSLASAKSSDFELKEDNDADFYLHSRSLGSSLQDIVNRLALPKLRGVFLSLSLLSLALMLCSQILRILQSEDDRRPFAMAKLASGKEVKYTSHLQAIPGTVKIFSHYTVMRTKDTNLLLTYYAGPCLPWYCSTYQYLSSQVPPPLQVAKDLLATVQAIHDAGFVHLDIKPANVCVPDGVLSSPGAVLIDFGSSQQISSCVCYPFGTVGWLAPEVECEQEDVDLCSVDVWATGKVLLYICQRLPQEVNGMLLLKEVGEALSAPTPAERIPLVAARDRLLVLEAGHIASFS
ncbi:hypothetical protein E1B28_003437 [Marasmius oreades]|uniref:Protein kinase domain-containing protein n=1 Tax=Marasmius oreades TaxID=181124 RepID=A0A9P7RN19_9AGAR|nr:uncharacterized protein E1B28_003437 [Marasmius oreades]KAG7085903.1 hypothetical protein E1B28_003437 [Marasmius oreades]